MFWRRVSSLTRQFRQFAMEPEQKKARKFAIGTHSGAFHCDEALACYMLRMTKEFKGAEVVRTRDQATLDTLAIVVDVGAVYDPSSHRYDHHQRGFMETLNENKKTKLSSAGLVYKHFGREIIESLLAPHGATEHTELIYDKIYDQFIEAIDAIDNGVNQYDTDQEPAYRVNTDLGSRVKNLNPAWNAVNPDENAAFEKASKMCGEEFCDAVTSYALEWLPARSIVADAVQSRFSVHPSGSIMKLGQFCPWKSHLYTIEEEQNIQGSIIYVLYCDNSGAWRIQCVSKHASSFENRKSLKESWRGIRDSELSALVGIEGAIFVHASGFIGGHKTYDGALAMAVASLEE